jgi:hypothetical protein
VRLDAGSKAGVAAIDLDGEGGGLLSGQAPAGTDVAISLDREAVTEVRTDDSGRFAETLPRLTPGAHRIDATGAGFQETLRFEVAPPPPLVGASFRSQVSPEGLRVDWLTPGGGVQTTILTQPRSRP